MDGRKAHRDRGNESPIARARMAAGLTQKQLADAVGSKQAEVTKWERGEREPRASKLKQIADALGCSVLDLMEPSDRADEQDGQEEEMTSEQTVRLIEWLKAQGMTDAQIVQCLEYIDR